VISVFLFLVDFQIIDFKKGKHKDYPYGTVCRGNPCGCPRASEEKQGISLQTFHPPKGQALIIEN
jgi:hypothetical protein